MIEGFLVGVSIEKALHTDHVVVSKEKQKSGKKLR